MATADFQWKIPITGPKGGEVAWARKFLIDNHFWTEKKSANGVEKQLPLNRLLKDKSHAHWRVRQFVNSS